MLHFSKYPAPPRAGWLACLLLGASGLWLPASHAALTINSTRVVFEGGKRNVAVTVTNPSGKPFAVQTWVNTQADDQTTAVPFMASPPLFRLNARKEQQVQIHGLPNTLPQDRESLFYFNVQEIPQREAEGGNQLNIALRTRIKLFYRPAGLRLHLPDALKQLSWSVKNIEGERRLVVNNPTPFHMSFVRIDIKANGQTVQLKNAAMAHPVAVQSYGLNGLKPGPGMQVSFSVITDYGGYTAPLTSPVVLDL